MKLVRIGRHGVKNAKGFVYDGCHKIYLVTNKAAEEDAKEHNEEILPMDKLEETYRNSCSLKFINKLVPLTDIVPQFVRQVTFTYDNGEKHIVKNG